MLLALVLQTADHQYATEELKFAGRGVSPLADVHHNTSEGIWSMMTLREEDGRIRVCDP
jgi:hypothetical protein